MMIDTGSLGHIRGGTLRPIAVASKERLPALPEVPTFTEAGVPMLASAWYGVMLPANAAPEIAERLNREFNAILASPQVRERLQGMGAQVGGGSVESFRRFALSEIEHYKEIVRVSGAPKE